MLLNLIKDWAPFQIDALGLVTILGATEVDTCVGRLVHDCLTEWLPLLGAYTIASGQVTKPISGFVLYNITDGIMSTDLSCWFTRWLLSLPLTYSATVLRVRPVARQLPVQRRLLAKCIGLVIFIVIVVLAATTGDWWGLANAMAMALSVLVRRVIVGQNRKAVDVAMQQAQEIADQEVKVFVTIPSGKSLTIYAPRMVVVNCFLSGPQPPSPRIYWAMRSIGWASFGIHVIALGMTCLFNQILTVCVLAGSSVVAVLQIGDFQSLIGTELDFDIALGDPNATRRVAYAKLNLSTKEEESMILWSMFPHKTNEFWWSRYRAIYGSLQETVPFPPSKQSS
ncbi:hypothetical protein PVAG01_02499 [Phlyctema vagabunda]|uniref:Uncharacterized protein n=1 Tax=Phlyctema vagabunda TaxID=108571 RepID=A0ABR4PRB2_9HELO